MRIVTDSVRVLVPATSANLGPGFDAFGLALALHDEVRVRATTGATRTTVHGEGAGQVPDGEDHLVVKAVRAGLELTGAPQVGLELEAFNAIPHGRGLGSSAAAVVAGLLAARGLISEPEALSDETMLEVATQWEGHPDNAAAAIYGGATIAWRSADGGALAEPLALDPALRVTALVPAHPVATRVARGVLPATVPHADAAFNLGRAALLVLALGGRRDLLLPATEDRLHQPYRREVLREAAELVARLRALGAAAVVSGAGPTVLVFDVVPDGLRAALAEDGWASHVLRVDHEGARLLP